MEAPFRTLANIFVPAMLLGLVYLLIHLGRNRAPVDRADNENLEDHGY